MNSSSRNSSTATGASGFLLLVLAGYALPSLVYGSAVYLPPARSTMLWLGVLAAFAQPQAGGLSISLGKPRPDASQEGISATEVRLSPQGAVTAMRLAGHVFAFERTATGALAGVTRDGAPLTLAVLPSARAPLTTEGPWSAGPLSFARLRGTPGAAER